MGKNNLNSFKLNIPGDPSSAAFITALTLLNKDSNISRDHKFRELIGEFKQGEVEKFTHNRVELP